MKKFTSKTKDKVNKVKENQKISNFFKKQPKNASNTSNTHTIVIECDEDVIPVTPDAKSIKTKPILTSLNQSEEINGVKRKISPSNLSSEQKIKRKNENVDPNTYNGNKTPEKSPKNGKLWGKKSSPQKSRSPKKKLFESSPDVNEFKVEVIDKFVKITPSKCSRNVIKVTPEKKSGSKQNSILNYISPSLSSRMQSELEKTPVKTPIKEDFPSTSRIKVKLQFEELKSDKKIIPEDEINGFMDDFGEFWDIDDDFETYSLDLNKPQHCIIVNYERLDRNKVEIVVKSTKNGEKAKCRLEGFWINTKLEIGSKIYLNATKDDQNWKITNSEGLLVYEPDLLITSTSVVGALFCKRRSVFKNRFYGFEPENKMMIVGTLVHTLLENALKSKAETLQEVEMILKGLLTTKDMNRMLYNTSLNLNEIKEDIKTYLPRIVEFIQNYIINKGNKSKKNDNWIGHIDSIQDIEETIWCPELGMKGNVDVTLQVGSKIMPLELKTGRATVSLEHRGQVMIYIMMMLKLGYSVSSGLLFYLKEGILKEVPFNEHERRDLMLLRNELGYFLRRKCEVKKTNDGEKLEMMELPEPIHHHSACEKCPYNVICCSYLRYEKYDLSSNKNLYQVSKNVLSHLNDNHIDYFVHWTNLLDLESSQSVGKDISSIYTIPPEEREKQGKCLTFLKLTDLIEDGDGFYKHTFKKSTENISPTFLISGLTEGSYVVISITSRPAVASGLVSFIDHKSIIVALERNLQIKYPSSTFHIDTYNSTSVNSFNFSNLAVLLEPNEKSKQLRSLIIDKSEPKYIKKLPRIVAEKAPIILKHLNKVQQRAVLKVLTAEDYVLIKGMPGTGKTATIVTLVELLTEIGQSVLITSYTHNAVDNVCLRLKKKGIKVLRLGSQGRIHPDLVDISEYELTKNCKSVEELEKVYNEANILAVTCLGSKHPVLTKRTLDVCLIDESTQALQCSLFRALSVCKKFVLIGDPDQLPPIVKNKQAISRGMSESLFERLQNEAGMVTLNLNYRMNETITNIANKFMYNGELKIGNENVAKATLNLSNLDEISQKWILKALSVKLEDSIKIIDTGKTYCLKYKPKFAEILSINLDEDEQLKCTNFYEIAIVYRLLKVLLKGKIQKENIGIIAPYRAQVAQLSTILSQTQVEINTVDQFQGQDKSVIIYSCTKSIGDPKITKYDILEDKRRLNVAITRAKHKLIIIGDVETIGKYSTFGKLFNCVDEKDFIRLENGSMDFDWEKVIDIESF